MNSSHTADRRPRPQRFASVDRSLNRTTPEHDEQPGPERHVQPHAPPVEPIEQKQRADEHHDEPEDDPRLTDTGLASLFRHVHTSRYAGARRRDRRFRRKPVNGR